MFASRKLPFLDIPDPIGVYGIFHTEEHPFCYSPFCFCHEVILLLKPLYKVYLDGLASAEDVDRIVKGETL